MLELSTIKDTVLQVADAITAAIGIESEIVDGHLKIIGGTGRYRKKIGGYEENGDLDSPSTYGTLLRTGKEYVCMDIESDSSYCPMEEEMAEIACPIQVESQIIGIIGLIAFTREQQRKIAENYESLLGFLRRMAELIASKLVETQSNNRLAILLESMPEGLLAVDMKGKIFACNFASQILLRKNADQLIGLDLNRLFSENEFAPETLKEYKEKEFLYMDGKKHHRFSVTIVPIPKVGTMLLFQDFEDIARNVSSLTNLNNPMTFDHIFGSSGQIQNVKERAAQVAEGNSTVLITGESGTGKELFARAIHTHSSRSRNAFIAINCAAIPEALLESELFGYEKGAFTGADKHGRPGKFELANHGTLFLDEIGDMPLHMQVKLLRVLQNKTIERIGGISSLEVDVRIIAATNKDLESMIRRKEFREDLYFRLNVIPLFIPPLRERIEDMEQILLLSLKRFNSILGKQIQGFTEQALEILRNYPWPGNVRELENAVEYAVTMEQGAWIDVDNLPDRIRKQTEDLSGEGTTLKERTDLAQKNIIIECLKRTGNDRTGKQKAAAVLGISESSLYRKMRELGIS